MSETPTTTTEQDPPEQKPTFSDYLRVFRYATKSDILVYAIASVASLGGGISLPLMNVIFGQLVGQFTDHFRDPQSMPREEFERILDKQALYIMALFLGRWFLNSINKFCFRMIGVRLSSAIRLHYLESLFAQSVHAIDSMPAGAPATAITSTSNTLQLGISERLGTFLQFNGTIWGSLVIAFIWSWELTLVTSSLIIYSFIVLSVVVPFLLKAQTAMVAADARGNAIASETLGGIRLVTACGAQERVLSRFKGHAIESRKQGQKTGLVVGIELGLLFFGIFGAFGLAFWYGTKRFVSGALDNSGVVVVVLMSVMMILTSLERVSTPLIAISKAMVAAREFFAIIDGPRLIPGSLKPNLEHQDLVLQDVSFEYPSRPGVKVLDQVNLRIPSGQNTALVGPSGSGKSTIVALIERWYSLSPNISCPSSEGTDASTKNAVSGRIMIGNHELDDIELRWWRSLVGLVQQEPFLFNDTIFANVANGLIGTDMEDEPEARKMERVEEACREAYAHEFVTRLPDGYLTRVGDGGAKLSGGQKQRLAIARSIVKKPQFILLDEATSAIDARSEKVVQAALDRISQSRTTITIAHRLSTIKKADNIVVLQNGRVVEQGTHKALVEKPAGLYHALVQKQSLGLPVSQDESVGPSTESGEEFEKMPVEQHNEWTDSVKSPIESPTSPGMMQSFGIILKEQRGQWYSYLGILVSAMSVAACTPIQAWLFAKVLEVFLLDKDDAEREASFWGLMWLALAAFVGIAYFFEAFIGFRVQYYISSVYKVQYLSDMLRQKIAFFDQDRNSHGELTSRVSGDPKLLEELLGLNLAMLLSAVFTALGSIIIALVFSWKLGLVSACVLMPVMIASGIWKWKHEVQFDKMNSAVFSESSQFATEAIGAIRTVSSLTMEPAIIERYKVLLNNHVKAALSKAKWTCAFYGFADTAGIGCQALIFWYGGGLLAKGNISFQAFFVCFMAMIQGAEATSQALSVAPDAAQASAAAQRILEVRSSAECDDGHDKDPADDKNSTSNQGAAKLELLDVHFKYPTRDVAVLNGISLAVEEGQYVAFVGPSGCGKTTIISLLERFYELSSSQGEILYNGKNIAGLPVHDYRNKLSLVAQEPVLFQGTVRDNVLFGIKDPDSISDERLHGVCRDASIHDFVASLPEGYNTDVGQKGVSMSGGQRQRIALARALIRNPQVLLLDEATSALDSASESIIQEALEKARAGRTIIAVAHRLSTIQNADVIFVLGEGKLIEKGSHQELLGKRGVYWQMCQTQALDL